VEHVIVLLAEQGERVRDARESGADGRQETAARVGKLHPPFLAHEQGAADPIFQLTDLIAYRGLCQPKFVRRPREILMPPRRLEGANRGKGRKTVHLRIIRSTYTFLHPFCWRARPP